MKNIMLSIFALTMVSGISCNQFAERVLSPNEGIQNILDQELQNQETTTIERMQEIATIVSNQKCLAMDKKILRGMAEAKAECNRAQETLCLLQKAYLLALPARALEGEKAGILASDDQHGVYVIQNGTYAYILDASTTENK